jgi:hypothetical protein
LIDPLILIIIAGSWISLHAFSACRCFSSSLGVVLLSGHDESCSSARRDWGGGGGESSDHLSTSLFSLVSPSPCSIFALVSLALTCPGPLHPSRYHHASSSDPRVFGKILDNRLDRRLDSSLTSRLGPAVPTFLSDRPWGGGRGQGRAESSAV